MNNGWEAISIENQINWSCKLRCMLGKSTECALLKRNIFSACRLALAEQGKKAIRLVDPAMMQRLLKNSLV